jgi:hypothetical protein
MSSTWLLLSLLTLDGIRAHSTAKPSRMLLACSHAKPSCEPGAFLFPWLGPARFLSFRAAHAETLAAHFADTIR